MAQEDRENSLKKIKDKNHFKIKLASSNEGDI